MNAYEYYRSVNPEISKKDYKSYVATFRGSKQEEDDLIEFYEKYDGNMKGLLENIIASRNEDLDRFFEFYEKMFKEKRLVKSKLYGKTKKQVRLLPEEEAEAKVEKQKMK